MAPTLQIIVPKSAAAEIPVSNSTAIGRLPENVVGFPEDLLMSREHCLIRQQGANEYVLIDLGSSNGTWLNSKLVVAPSPLKHLDEIVVGGALIRFNFPEQQEIIAREKDREAVSRTMVGIRLNTVVILVCDIRNFTRLSEILPPERLAKFLGVWFRTVSDLIRTKGGVVDKYIGDAFLAYWTVDKADPALAATQAILSAQALLEIASSIKTPEDSGMDFKVGIGVNQGVVASGNVGGNSQRDSSIMGDAVNIAFRLESLCKETGYPIVASQEVISTISTNFPFISVGHCTLKGKSEPLEVFGLRS